MLGRHGLDVRVIDGPVGAASALKLSYAGITKGLVAIAATMVLAAERAGAGPALRAELAASQPQLLVWRLAIAYRLCGKPLVGNCET
ncbi:hypothetical protein [Bradyrhizobium sp. WD16]|uniref:hypothetical protein n=1 Tax=Bradyrhizobium sp. WD16 TaxID=1521768 RepID=UPI0020A23C50|nr:hypothetical protein [Bradyrhizobium sp. WD16]